jgi:DNA-binding NtrC family response regulator
MKIIVIDDEKIKRIITTDSLLKAGYEVESFESPLAALSHFENFEADVVITDIRMPVLDGFDVLQKVKAKNPNTIVILMTAYGTIQSAVEAMKLGAYDYLTKPFSSDQLLLLMKKVEQLKMLKEENFFLKKKLEERFSFHNIIGKSHVMQQLYEQLETISKNNMSILIEGESGTGKEVVANAIHFNSLRKDKPFIKLNCAVLNDSLLESELFGHEKGAFTGAIKDKKGRFELANGGTLFLDDVDDMPPSSQVKLLRVLQEKEFERVGGNTLIKVDVRIICATKVNLWEKVKKGEFREDLYYRLRVIPIDLPPLRKKKEDIPLLLNHCAKKIGREGIKFTPEALDLLCDFDWPGNVRQLENTFYRIAAFAESNIISKEMIPSDIADIKADCIPINFDGAEKIDIEKILEEVEISAIKWAINKTNSNQTKSAQLLGIKRTTFRDKLIKYKIN